MDQPEVLTIDQDLAVRVMEERIAAAPVAAPSKEQVLCDGKYNLYDLLVMFKHGEAGVAKKDRERWTVTFAAAASVGGIWAVRQENRLSALAVYWKTKNPYVELSKEIPKLSPDGNHAYIGWFWSDKDSGWRLIRHIRATLPTVEFISWHDQREKLPKKERGKLYVMELPQLEVPKMLKNGVAR